MPSTGCCLNDGTGNFANGTITGLAIDEFAAWDRLLTNDEISILSQTNLDALALNGIVGDVNQDGVVSGDGTGPCRIRRHFEVPRGMVGQAASSAITSDLRMATSILTELQASKIGRFE